MTTTELQAGIIAKQEFLHSIICDNVQIPSFLRQLVNKKEIELIELKQQLETAEVDEIKATPIPSGWICPRCQKVHNWMVQSCDCSPNVITASTTEPIKELAEIKGEDKRCPECGRDRVFYPNGKMNWHCRCGFAFE